MAPCLISAITKNIDMLRTKKEAAVTQHATIECSSAIKIRVQKFWFILCSITHWASVQIKICFIYMHMHKVWSIIEVLYAAKGAHGGAVC
jgi:hypothetical protein